MRLLAAVDLDGHAEEVVAQVTHWALALDALTDLAFVDEYRYSAALIPDLDVRRVVEAQWAKVSDAHMRRLEELRQLMPERVRGQARVLEGRAAQAIVEAAVDYDAVLLATHGRSGLGHALLGSVAERVLRQAPCPVITLRLPQTG